MTRPGLDDGDRNYPVLLIPNLGHAELAPEDSLGSHRFAFFWPTGGPAARERSVGKVPGGALVRLCRAVPLPRTVVASTDVDLTSPWKPDEARRSRMVFIGRNLDEAALKRGFDSCIAA